MLLKLCDFLPPRCCLCVLRATFFMVTNAELAKEVGDRRAEMAKMRDSLKMFKGMWEKVEVEIKSWIKENKLLNAENKEVA